MTAAGDDLFDADPRHLHAAVLEGLQRMSHLSRPSLDIEPKRLIGGGHLQDISVVSERAALLISTIGMGQFIPSQFNWRSAIGRNSPSNPQYEPARKGA
jgi:hypothetical protein